MTEEPQEPTQETVEEFTPPTHVEQPLPDDKSQTAADYVDDKSLVDDVPELVIPEGSTEL